MHKVAIVGGGGFIGKNLSFYLVTEGFEVVVINRSIKKELNISNIHQIKVDILDIEKLLQATEDCVTVIWLVNGLVPSSSVDSLTFDFNYNVSPLIKFLEGKKNNYLFSKFIFVSSGGTVYGDSLSKTYFSESDNENPISIYGLSKLIAERYVSFLTLNSGFSSIILRPSNLYGNFFNLNKPQGIIGFCFNSIKKNQKLIVFDNGISVRDFVHVIDFCKAIKILLLRDFKLGFSEIFNVGSGYGVSISELLHLIEKITNCPISIEYHPKREFDCDFNVLNIEKIKNEINWSPEISLLKGLESSWEWFSLNNINSYE